MPEKDLEARLCSYLARRAAQPASPGFEAKVLARPGRARRFLESWQGQVLAAAAIVGLAVGLGIALQTARQSAPATDKPSPAPSASTTVIMVPAPFHILAGPWVPASPSTVPEGREGAAMAYDGSRGQVVLFGGTGCPGRCPNPPVFGDTWIWDGGTWTRRQPSTSPSPRYRASMAYDAERGVVVLFGGAPPGFTRTQFGDTWTWDGQTWIEKHPAASPPARSGASIAYDAARKQVVLFGGGNFAAGEALADTWLWDGSNWSRQSPATSPPARTLASMAYDGARQLVVLYGGSPSAANYLGDTWTWDGRSWREQRPSQSLGAKGMASMAYDQESRAVVLFGGESCSMGCVGSDQSMWIWDGYGWTHLEPQTSPPPRFGGSMTYDAKRHQVVLFGGRNAVDYLSDTWTWRPS